MKNHYTTLGLDVNASREDVRKAFRTLTKKYHPDRKRRDSDWATAKMLDVIEAIDGPLIPVLPAGGGLHAQSRAKLKRALAAVTAATRQELQAVKLSHLLPDRRRRTAARRKAPAHRARSGRLRKAHR